MPKTSSCPEATFLWERAGKVGGWEEGEEEGTSQTQTMRAEPDSFIRRLLKGRVGQAEGKGRTPLWPGWNKL